jgi:hypothetical protein
MGMSITAIARETGVENGQEGPDPEIAGGGGGQVPYRLYSADGDRVHAGDRGVVTAGYHVEGTVMHERLVAQ